MMKKKFLHFAVFSALMASCHLTRPTAHEKSGPPPGQQEIIQGTTNAQEHAPDTRFVSSHSVTPHTSLYTALRGINIDTGTILKWVKSAKSIFNLEGISPDTNFSIVWDSAEHKTPIQFELRYAADSSLVITRDATDLEWTAQKREFPISFTKKTFNGTVKSTLWASAEDEQVDPSLITNLAEVFAWQIDFNREVRVGDRWRLTVEQKWIDGQPAGWGNILVAEYENGDQQHIGVRYPQIGTGASYYAPNGQSLKRMFLKSPIKFGRITSGFSKKRFHPILRESRPHNGVDYGAPTGTPVLAVGKGQVVQISYNPASGKTIKIRHNGMYDTAYLHLSRFADGLRKGSIVEQADVIGYVGATGLATGPHLHFAFFENGVYKDPMGIRFPSADPVPGKDMTQFQSLVATMIRTLPEWRLARNETKTQESDSNMFSSATSKRTLMH